jgi:hypothetical protein
MKKTAKACGITAGEVKRLVESFLDCSLKPDDFHHREHLIVAWSFNLQYRDSAIREFKAAFLRYTKAHGLSRLYHETITLFWLRLVALKIASSGNGTDSLACILAEIGDSKLIYSYYSKELLEQEDSRAGWVEPDLRPLPPMKEIY